MKTFRLLLLALAVAAAGALGWTLLAEDPGQVYLVWRGYSVETTLIVFLLALLLAWLLLRVLLWALRLPFRSYARASRRRARRRLADGLMAAHEGRHARARKLLTAAGRHPRTRRPALLQGLRSAEWMGDEAAAERQLRSLHEIDPAAAQLESMRRLLARGEPAGAVRLSDDVGASLAPAALLLRVQALAALRRAAEALTLLPELRRAEARPTSQLDLLETGLQAAALQEAGSVETLVQRWSALSRSARLEPLLVSAYSARTRELGEPDAGDRAIQAALKKVWSDLLVADFGRTTPPPHGARLRLAEGWLATHEDSAALQLCLGRMCREDELWGKAEAHLQRAIELGAGSPAWEELAAVFAALGSEVRARSALQNALRAARGDTTAPLPTARRLGGPGTREAAEQRSPMGVPLLSQDRSGTEDAKALDP